MSNTEKYITENEIAEDMLASEVLTEKKLAETLNLDFTCNLYEISVEDILDQNQ